MPNYGKVELNKFHDSAERTMLTKDIRAINESFEVDKIILSTHKGIKIASSLKLEAIYVRSMLVYSVNLIGLELNLRKLGLDKQKRFTETEEEFIEGIYRR